MKLIAVVNWIFHGTDFLRLSMKYEVSMKYLLSMV